MVETMTEPLTNGDDLEIHALSRSQVAEAADFTREQALALVGLFYSIQKQRVGQSNRVSAHNRRVDVLADTSLVVTLKEDLHKIEKQAARGLKAFAKAQPLGRWAMQIAGVDGVLAAGLLAHIDVTKAATAGGIWRFAGLDPTIKWEKGQKRPYNAQLKVLCFKLGECFKRLTVSREKMTLTDSDLDALEPKKRTALLNRRANFLEEESYLYVRLYAKRKELLIQRNESGHYAEKAKQRFADMRRLGRKMSEEQRDTWLSGKLQACGLDMMAMEHAVTIFLAHYHQVGREMLGLPVPRPWVVEHGGHSHVLPPPCWPMIEE